MKVTYLFQVSGEFLDRHLGGVLAHDAINDCEYEYDIKITDGDIDEFCEENGIDREDFDDDDAFYDWIKEKYEDEAYDAFIEEIKFGC